MFYLFRIELEKCSQVYTKVVPVSPVWLMPRVMRRSVIRTHLWPSLSEMSGWLKSGPLREVSRWPINNPSPQHGGSHTSKNNKAAAWIWCLDSICDSEGHLYAFAASIPAKPDYHFTPSSRQQSSASLSQWCLTLHSVQCVDSCVFATPPKRKYKENHSLFDKYERGCGIFIHLICILSVRLSPVHFSVSWDSLDVIFTTCFPVQHTGDENINEMPEDWWLTGCYGEKKKINK